MGLITRYEQQVKYPGSKARLAKHLLPIILESRSSPDQLYIEPFVGGCNMIDKVNGNRWGNDSNNYLIDMWVSLQRGWEPPGEISEDIYINIKKCWHAYPGALIAFVAIQCSFGAKWFGGYARGKTNKGESRNYAGEGRRHLIKQIKKLKGVKFINKNYWEMVIPDDSIIYCDPPYKNTIKYKDKFNHPLFWAWCRKMSKTNKVFISEYSAPSDFICLIEIEHKTTIDINQHDKRTERLFIYQG